MAEAKKVKTETKAASKAQKPAGQAKAADKAQQKQEAAKAGSGAMRSRYAAVAVIAILAVLVLYVLFGVVPNVSGVPFSSFKTSYDSAPTVAVVVTFANNTQQAATEPCYSLLLQVIARDREASTIGFYLLNQTTCTYSSTGLGGQANIVTANASKCLAIANAEPTIFLNYSQANSSMITPTHLYIYGNSAYFASCPVASEFG